MKEKQTLTRDAPRYRPADRKTKSGILDEYSRLTGFHRKYAMALLKGWGKETFLSVEGKPYRIAKRKG
jgi:hypothetical protein